MSQSSKYIDNFLEMLVVERGLAQASLNSYTHALRHFLEFKGSDIARADADDIREYVAQMERLGLKPSTAQHRLSVLRQFFRFLQAERMRHDDPTHSINSPRRVRSQPTGLTEAEVEQLLDGARTYAQKRGGAVGPRGIKSAEGIRLVALMELLYDTLLGVSGLLMLPYPAVQPNGPFVMVEGRDGRRRKVRLSERAMESLAEYERVRSHFVHRPADEDWLFPSRSKEGHLSRQRFTQIVKELAECTGIDVAKVSAQSLRQGCIAHRLANDADPELLQQIRGVKNIETVLKYARVSEQQKQDLVRFRHPLSGYKD